MVNYKCQRCGYETINKTMLKRHVLRKNICHAKLKEVNKYDLLIYNEFFEEARLYLDNVNKNTKIPIYPQKHPQNVKIKVVDTVRKYYQVIKIDGDMRKHVKKITIR